MSGSWSRADWQESGEVIGGVSEEKEQGWAGAKTEEDGRGGCRHRLENRRH